jgi:hypothetical protein
VALGGGLGVTVSVGVGVRVAVGVFEGTSVAVRVAVALGRRVGDAVAVGVSVAVGGSGVALARRVGRGVVEAGCSVAVAGTGVAEGRGSVEVFVTIGVVETSLVFVTTVAASVAEGDSVAVASSVNAAVTVG